MAWQTVYRWASAYRREGLLGLVDRRHLRGTEGPGAEFPEFRDMVAEIMGSGGGDRSNRRGTTVIKEAARRLSDCSGADDA